MLLKSYLLTCLKGDEEGADKVSIEYSTVRKMYDNDGRVILLSDVDTDEVGLGGGIAES